MIIFASDLDNTLIFGKHRLDRIDTKPIENYDPPSHMIISVHEKLEKLQDKLIFVPVTTRSIAQYDRIQLYDNVPSLAFCSNGGNLFVNGNLDSEYSKNYKQNSTQAIIQMENCVKYLENEGLAIRNVDELFYYTKTSDIQMSDKLRAYTDTDLVEIEVSAEKFYVFPKTLNKGIVIDELRKRYPQAVIIAAGDSLMDVPMLAKADIALTLEENSIENSIVCKQGNFSEFIINYLSNYVKDKN